MRFKHLEGKPEWENPKRTVSTSNELGLLQDVSCLMYNHQLVTIFELAMFIYFTSFLSQVN